MRQLAGDLPDGSSRLLTEQDPAPVIVENPGGSSVFLLLGDHAGRAIPLRLRNLGLKGADQERHIAWDIGVGGLGGLLARRIDATFVHQVYSRLVIDCNRAPGGEGSIAAVSDETIIPGNAAVGPAERQARLAEIFKPYHDRIASVLDERRERGRRTLLVSLHSFTPAMSGQSPRPWRFGVLHRGDSAFSRAVLAALRGRWGEAVGDNQPYAMDGVDFTVPHHADARGLDYLELEVRQDLIDAAETQAALIEPLAGVLAGALDSLDGRGGAASR